MDEYRKYLLKTIDEGSVMMVRPREPMTITIKQYKGGWCAYAFTGDGSKPGSLMAAEFCIGTAQEAFEKVMNKLED